MKRMAIAIVVGLVTYGCSVYDSTYWRHPVTGVIVECDCPWEYRGAYSIDTAFRDRCEDLMQRAGLVGITHDEGEEWERKGRP